MQASHDGSRLHLYSSAMPEPEPIGIYIGVYLGPTKFF